MQSPGKASGPMTAINITPLVDVVLVLLIIFMVTAPMIAHRTIKVDIPKAAHHSHTSTKAVQIAMDAKTQIYFSGKPVSQSELSALLAQTFAANPDTRVTLAADKSVAYGHIVALLDIIRGSKIHKIGLEVKSL
jgi:biopolymer transport protein ExbD